MNAGVTSSIATTQEMSGAFLIRKKAFEALNACHRDAQRAMALFEQWVSEDDDLYDAIVWPAVHSAITAAVTEDVAQERRDTVRRSLARPPVTNMVSVGGSPVKTALPQEISAAAEERRRARLVKYLALYGLALPKTHRPLGEARPWEVRNASQFYAPHRKAAGIKERFYALVWAACPDKGLPAEKQRPVSKQVSEAELTALWRQAEIAEASKTL